MRITKLTLYILLFFALISLGGQYMNPTKHGAEQVFEDKIYIADANTYIGKNPAGNLILKDIFNTEISLTTLNVAGSATWGSIGGTLSAQTDLQNVLNGKESANVNIQTHVTSIHAPANAQANADITKAEIEAKLTGTITTHTHASSGGLGYTINVQALTSSPVDAQTIYFGMLPKVPVTVVATSKIYIRKAGTIKIAEIYCYSGTAGTNQSWSLYVRKNNATDYLIATLAVTTNERIFSNTGLDIAVVAGDYVEIKSINPTWTTNPLTCIFGGYLYIE